MTGRPQNTFPWCCWGALTDWQQHIISVDLFWRMYSPDPQMGAFVCQSAECNQNSFNFHSKNSNVPFIKCGENLLLNLTMSHCLTVTILFKSTCKLIYCFWAKLECGPRFKRHFLLCGCGCLKARDYACSVILSQQNRHLLLASLVLYIRDALRYIFFEMTWNGETYHSAAAGLKHRNNSVI